MNQILSIPDQLGPLIQAARKTNGLSQTELAKRLGVGQSRVSAMELDPGSIRVDQLITIFAALNLELKVQSKGLVTENAARKHSPKVEW
jgi:HTH-type transcriptional regulator/antitoxin HipB